MARFSFNLEEGRKRILAKLPEGYTLDTVDKVNFQDKEISERMCAEAESLQQSKESKYIDNETLQSMVILR
ncbi:MAG TPA: hypothetical protein VD908_18135 [Cytophagales bacterium]|nr:hypothetical protein [Cytophagales bacterium]